MVVENGYKNTEIGIIPEDWNINTLKNVCLYRRGSFPQPYGLAKWYDEINGAPFVQVFDIDHNWKIKPQTKRYISKVAQELSIFAPKESILLTIQGSIGRIAITQYDAYVDRTLLIFESFKIAFDKKYFCLAIETLFEREKKNAPGGIIKTITKEALSVFEIPIPPLPEQTAIAAALSDMDSLIAQTEKLIEKKKAIKQGVMQELLRPKEAWVSKKLGDLLEYEQPTKYIVKSDKYSDNNSTPVLTAGKSFVLGYTSEEFNLFEDLPTIIFDDFTTASQYVDFKFKVKSSAMKILKLRNKKMDLRFIFEMLQNIKYQVADHKRHWIGEFQNIEIFLPELDEMNQLGKIVKEINQEIELLETKQNKLKLQKQGMMQALLTGKIRLV